MGASQILGGIAVVCLAVSAIALGLSIGFVVASDSAAKHFDFEAQRRREDVAMTFGLVGGVALLGVLAAVSMAGT